MGQVHPIETAGSQDERTRVGPPSAAMLSIALGLLLGARLVALAYNATDLFFDEAQYWAWSREPAFGYYSKPPLIAWIIATTTTVCGSSEFCVRLPAPILHTGTAVLLYLTGCRLYGPAVGFWAALVFATLPGVSLSSGIISTDVPLLFFWALALWAFVELRATARWWPAVLLGAALGLGMNAKYAMVFFLVSVLVYVLSTRPGRGMLRDGRLYAALAIAALLTMPNLIWNLGNGFATFAHTADNAKWGGSLLNVGKGLEFLGAQLGVFGPVLFVALLWIGWRAWRQGLPEKDQLLLAFVLPVLLIITAQAFVSRAHANWAATAYVAASVLVAAVLLRLPRRGLLTGSVAAHALLVPLIAVATWQAGQFRVPFAGDPFARTLGWQVLAAETRDELRHAREKGEAYGAVITDDRAVTAELLYYMRDEPTPVLAWRRGGRPHDHFELTRPYTAETPGPALLVSVKRDASHITRDFGRVEPVGERRIAAGAGEPRRVRFFALGAYRSQSSD